MKFNSTMLALATAAVFSGPAQALVVVGDTTGGPTFNRPLTLTSTSAVGTAVPYTVLPFTVSVTGSYIFLTTTTGAYDPYVALYTTFAPATPLANLLAINDDLTVGNFNASGFTFALNAGTTYRYVVTGFDNTDFGAYTTSITGPGNVVVVPEPETYALMALGLAGVLVATLRRRTRA